METHGRERRWRYFTFASYREIIANEKLDDQDGPYSSVDCFNVGNFAPFVAEDFYADVAELNRITDYAFSKTGKVEDVGEEAALKRVRKVATPTRGNKRKRGEAGPDVDADGEVGRTPRKRGRPRKYPVESQDGTGAAGKVATLTSDNDHIRQSFGENTEATQQGATGTTNDRHSPSPGVLRKRAHPPDDSVVPEASKPTKRRGRSRKQPTSLPPIDETVDHPPPQNDTYPSHVHVARRPLPEPPPPPPPNADAEAAEAQPTPKGCDVALQHTSHGEVSTQPDNQHNSTQPAVTKTVSIQGRTETVGEPETEGDIAQMEKFSDPSVLVGHTLGNASAPPQDSRKVTGVERADSVSGKMFLVVKSRATRLTSEWP